MSDKVKGMGIGSQWCYGINAAENTSLSLATVLNKSGSGNDSLSHNREDLQA